MTAYVVRHRSDQRFWTGAFDGWSTDQAEAQVFEFMTDATMHAYLECAAEPGEWAIEPIAVTEITL